MTKLCLRCRGQKKVQGMGWMEADCPNCSGLGRIPNDEIKEPLVESVTESLDKLDSFKGAPSSPNYNKKDKR